MRGRLVGPIIQDGKQNLLVRATLHDGRTVGLSKHRGGATELHIDRARARRLSEAAALLPVQVILPDVGQLVFGGPGTRRQCLDWGLFHVKPAFLAAQRAFIAAIRQRNAVLKSWGTNASRGVLQSWTAALCRRAEVVHRYRSEYVDRLVPHFKEVLSALESRLNLQIRYRGGWGNEPLAQVMEDRLDSDLKSGATSAGPHRADLQLKMDDKEAGARLSRGQGKLVATALVLAQAELLRQDKGRQSLLLFDDLGAELDSEHGARLLKLLRDGGGQVISTSTRAPGNDAKKLYGRESWATFHVKQGRISSVQ